MKILSIDFDTIMFPCIRLYNDYCMGDENDSVIWRQIEFERDIQQYLKYDANVYRNIARLIFKNIQNGAKLIPIREHQELVNHLIQHDLMEFSFDITNVDFHHDIAYDPGSFIQMDFDKYTCADWAGYLMTQNPETSLTWVRCPGSSPYNQEMHEFKNSISIKRIDELADLDDDYNLIYFCLSPQWVPYDYHHLYHLIIDLAGIACPTSLDGIVLKPVLMTKEVAIEIPVDENIYFINEINPLTENSNEPEES